MKSALAHEQAKNQRLETRLRSLMSTPEFTAEGLSLGSYSGFACSILNVLYIFLITIHTILQCSGGCSNSRMHLNTQCFACIVRVAC